MRSAQPDTDGLTRSHPPEAVLAAPAPYLPASRLQQHAAERLAAHRSRRGLASLFPPTRSPGPDPAEATPPVELPRESRLNRIAATVAERYAHSQSYCAFLAAEAQRAIVQAQAAAEIATRTAEAVATAQQQFLSELAQAALQNPDLPIKDLSPSAAPVSVSQQDPCPAPSLFETSFPSSSATGASAPALPSAHMAAGLSVRLYERPSPPPPTPFTRPWSQDGPDEEQSRALDEEIAFRKSPVFEAPLTPLVPLPANLLEFPRQLVAARRARPRYAEGPLREESTSYDPSQLRIFEVEPTEISLNAAAESMLPVWATIRLGAQTPGPHEPWPDRELDSPATLAHPNDLLPHRTADRTAAIHIAPFGRRMMASAMDAALIGVGALIFAGVTILTAGRLSYHLLLNAGTVTASGGSLLLLALLYHLLFFTASDATPGMRYARIALCTFSDQNPSRAAMRRRVPALVLAAAPLGLGLLWAWLDDDGLGWHDRISRTYQRSY